MNKDGAIECGYCKSCAISLKFSGWKENLEQGMLEYGWRFHADYGWICPDCVQRGVGERRKMHRLTERDEYGNADIIGVNSPDLQLNLSFNEFNLVTDALNRLADYEDADERLQEDIP